MTWRKPADRVLVNAILQVFRGDAERSYGQLSTIPLRTWNKTDFWLNASGLALYFLDQVSALGIADAVPPLIHERLRSSLRKNKVRTGAMFREFRSLNASFHKAGLLYLNHKGITFCPHSCPSPELRHQTDFDFLIARNHLLPARDLLEANGYSLNSSTSKTWEFKAGNYARRKWDNYSMGAYRSVELHFGIGSNNSQDDERLHRIHPWTWGCNCYPALGAADQLIGQALHLFGHLRGESTRPAWLLEFRRHILSRRDDTAFWTDVAKMAENSTHASMALGISVLIASDLFGRFAPREFEQWAVGSVCPTVRLWVDRYGIEAVLADFPGTKLFLLLEQELERLEKKPPTAVRTRLLPLRRARPIFAPRRNETSIERFDRNIMRCRFIIFRARFHITQAVRYLIELPKWNRLLRQHRNLLLSATSLSAREMTTCKQLNDNLNSTSL